MCRQKWTGATAMLLAASSVCGFGCGSDKSGPATTGNAGASSVGTGGAGESGAGGGSGQEAGDVGSSSTIGGATTSDSTIAAAGGSAGSQGSGGSAGASGQGGVVGADAGFARDASVEVDTGPGASDARGDTSVPPTDA